MLIDVADPAPDDPLPTLSHAAPGVAVQGQLACVVIDAVTILPAMHG